MTRISFALLLIAPLLFTLSPAAVSAKPLAKIIADTGLSPQDFEILQENQRALLDVAKPAPGQTRSWDNPETGSKGTVELTTMRGGCAYLKHLFFPKGRTRVEELDFRMCPDAAGVWRLTP